MPGSRRKPFRAQARPESEFTAEMTRLLRRYQLLWEVEHGNLELVPITVHRKKMTWTVRAKSRTYVRYIAPKGWKKPDPYRWEPKKRRKR